MKAARGMALAVSLVLLMLLSLLAFAGARLAALELSAGSGEQIGLLARETAQSLVDERLREGCLADCGAGATVVELALPLLPPPPGAGYSADKLAARTFRLEGEMDGAAVAEGLAVLAAVDPPALASLCAPGPASAPRAARVLVDGVAQEILVQGGSDLQVSRADTGEVLWQGTHPSLADRIVSAPALLDADGDGATDRLVIGDSGGGVWRADLRGPVSQWRLTLLARLPGRFFVAPELVQERDDAGAYVGVLIGSGDLARPLERGREDSLWYIEDRNLVGADREPPDAAWRLALGEAGEKLLTSPLTVARSAYFAVYVPGATCEAGHAELRALSYTGRSLRALDMAVDGLPLSIAYAGRGATVPAPGCRVKLSAGAQSFEVPGCTRFRTWWERSAP